jgi:hypothetical protein
MPDQGSEVELNGTCVIVGAGASFDCFGDGRSGVPLTRDLLVDSRNKLNLQLELITSVADRIRTLSDIKEFPSIDDLDEPLGRGLERTLGFLMMHASSDKSGIRAECSDLVRQITRAVRNAISNSQLTQFFNDGSFDSHRYNPPKNYGWLVAACSVATSMSIITLNYDCLLDNVFKLATKTPNWPSPIQYEGWLALLRSVCALENTPIASVSKLSTKAFLPPEHGMYVKLHGTLFTYCCLNEECKCFCIPVLHKRVTADLPDMIELGFSNDPQHHCIECGNELFDLIIPPGNNKNAGTDALHTALAGTAAKILQRCKRILVIGYSFPEYDRDVVNLILEGCRSSTGTVNKELYIIAPDAKAIGERCMATMNRVDERATSLIKGTYFRNMTFSEFVSVAPLGE